MIFIKERRGHVRQFGQKILDTLLPPLCLTCRGQVAAWGALCAPCFDDLHFIEEPFCEKLCLPFDYAPEGELLSQEAQDFPPNFESARAVLLFTPAARKLVHGVKYHDRLELTAMLAQWMVRAGRPMIAKSDVIIPVPLHWTRLFTRKFNQAAELARAISHLTQKPYHPLILKRVKRTVTQTGLSRIMRHKNMQDAFALHRKAAIKGQTIVLVDDVFTTGATLEACTAILLKGGAKAVHVLTLARVVVSQEAYRAIDSQDKSDKQTLKRELSDD
jgi:ComF family protein